MDWMLPLVWNFVSHAVVSHAVAAAAALGARKMIEICRRRRLRKPVEKAYKFLRMWCEPDTLANPDETNMDFMASESRDEINLLHRRLDKAGMCIHPGWQRQRISTCGSVI